MVRVNGESYDFAGKTVFDCINELGFNAERIAAELNEEFLPKSQHKITYLKDGDALEIVSFVGGG